MENPWLVVILAWGLVVILLAGGMWIATALGLSGIVLIYLLIGGERWTFIGPSHFHPVNTFTFTAIPIFIFMGTMLLNSGISDRLYTGATALVGFLPGGLLHTNIAACSIFAAISGSGIATAATIGSVAIPELMKRKYNRRLLFGSIAAGGPLGLLIPPSISMIIYGAFVGESIGKLFIGGIFPGIILAVLYMSFIGIISLVRPNLALERIKFGLRPAIRGVFDMWGVAVLVFLVLGTIYLGIATPTEAAAMGATGSIIMCALYRKLNWGVIKQASLDAVKITSWVMLVAVGALTLSLGLSLLKVPAQLAAAVTGLGLPNLVILFLVVILYILLGMFIDDLAMMVLTLPVIYPIMMGLGFDSVWFGIALIVLIMIGEVTPPMGLALYVVHGISGKKYLNDIIIGSIPFVLCMLALLVLLTAFPSLATWLPGTMMKPWG